MLLHGEKEEDAETEAEEETIADSTNEDGDAADRLHALLPSGMQPDSADGDTVTLQGSVDSRLWHLGRCTPGCRLRQDRPLLRLHAQSGL